jgi:uncharacterized glyoxalase superfamily protein PhnB
MAEESELVVRAASSALRRHVQRYCGYAELGARPTRQQEPLSNGVRRRVARSGDNRPRRCRRVVVVSLQSDKEDEMANQSPNIYPFMRFADANAGLEWLARAFGFQEHAVYRDDGGTVQHAELSLGPGIVMFGQGDASEQGVYVAVDDVDAHYERAKAAGAQIVRELEDTDYGSREYTARDPEGHVWSFGSYRPEVGA